MSVSSLMVLLSALAVVLGVFTILLYVARRFRGLGGTQQGVGHIEVLSRAGLGPRQGVATIRVGDQVAVVTYGDGGVRHVMDVVVPEADAPGAVAPGVEAPVLAPDSPFASALARAGRKVVGIRAMMLTAALFSCSVLTQPLVAQEDTSPPAAQVGTTPAISGGGAAQTGGSAPQVSISLGADGEALQLSGPVGTVIFFGFMTLLPTLLLLMTGFTRILIVLHLLKQALGTQTAPPAHLLAAMALLLTGFVMAPTFDHVNRIALEPWMAGETDEMEMLKAASGPMRDFMLSTTREQDLAAFVSMRGGPTPETIDDVPLVVVMSAFVTSELTSAFQMGFALFLPFVVIDVVVASVLMSMGMFMLPPVMVSLPFKLLLFVLVDGWSLVMGSLIQSF